MFVRTTRASLAALASLLLALAPAVARAAWSTGGNPVADSTRGELPHGAIPDEAGGMIVSFGFQNGDSLSAQKLDLNGNKAWGSQGVRVNAGGNAASFGLITADSLSGAWVVWADSRTTGTGTGLYAQRIDAGGSIRYGAGGLKIHNRAVQGLAVSTTPGGKLLVAWLEGGSSGGDSLVVQRYTTNAAPEWPGEGVLLATDGGTFASGIQVHPDGEGAVVVYNRFRLPPAGASNTQQVYAQRVSSTGVPQWAAGGVQVYAATGANGIAAQSAWDGTALYLAWEQAPSAYNFVEQYPIRAQKLNVSGVAQWAANGVTVFTPNTAGTFFQHIPMQARIVATPGLGGAIVAWMDGRNYNQPAPNTFLHGDDIYGQRLNSTGAAQWTANGAPLDSLPGGLDDLLAVTDQADGVILGYTDFTFGDGDEDIKLRRVNSAGATVWQQTVNIITGTDRQRNAVLASDRAGGALCAWEDNRNAGADTDVYGTRRSSTGSVFAPSIAVTQPNGGEVFALPSDLDIRWTTNFPQNVRVLLRRDGSPPQDLTPGATANDGQFTYTLPANTLPGQYKVIVKHHDDPAPADSSNAFFTICAPFVLADSIGSFTAPNELKVADLNEDGRLDAVVAYGTGGAVSLGLPGGTFGPPTDLGIGSGGRDVAIEDFDSDGILDLAITTTNGVSVLLGNGAADVGDGTFGAPVNYPTEAGPRGIASADFNEDGNLDLAVVNGVSNTVSILIGNGVNGIGDGTFTLRASHAVGSNPQRVLVGDFNEDGIWDLANTNNLSGGYTVTVLLGQGLGGIGNGNFSAALAFATGANPISIVSGDFTGDGVTDLVTAGSNAASGVTLLAGTGSLGVGNGGFATPFSFPFGGTGRDVEVADVDRDGRPDVLVSSSTLNTVVVMHNTGGAIGTLFSQGASTYAGLFPNALALGDYDADGDIDVLCANNLGNNLSRLLADCAEAAVPAVQVVSPNGGESMGVGSARTISFTRSSSVPFVDVQVSRDAGTNWETIARRLTDASFVWTVTAPLTTTARIRVVDAARGNVSDVSDANFSITTGVLGSEDTRLPSVTAFSAPQPNPSRGRVSFELALPREDDVTVEAFDLLGRRVAVLAHGRMAAGRHVIRWQGGELAGRAGVLLVRARASGFERTQRVVLVP